MCEFSHRTESGNFPIQHTIDGFGNINRSLSRLNNSNECQEKYEKSKKKNCRTFKPNQENMFTWHPLLKYNMWCEIQKNMQIKY